MTTKTTEGAPRLVPRGTGRVRQVGGDLVRVKTSGRDTGGRYEVFEIVSSPDSGVPLHTHEPGETFYVLEGRFRFRRADGDDLDAGPGDVVVIPPQAPHAFRNVGDGVGRLVTVLAPAGMEDFFDAVGLPVPEDATEPAPLAGPADLARVLAIAEAHGITIVEGQPGNGDGRP